MFRCAGCSQARTATIVLRGGSEQFIDEAERSLHDAICIVRRALKHAQVVPGGGAVDMEVSRALRDYARCASACENHRGFVRRAVGDAQAGGEHWAALPSLHGS